MKLVNQSKGVEVCPDLSLANSFSERTKGLIGEKIPRAILFKTRWGIHTFGMKFPIDCVVLDRQYRVGAICLNMGPNRVFFWNPRLSVVVELPEGTVKKSNLNIGDWLVLRED